MKLPEFLGKGRGGVQIFALPFVHYSALRIAFFPL